MAGESRRACGWRKIHGLYLIGDKGDFSCCKLPIPLPKHTCDVCGLDHTVHQTRGWMWINPRPMLESKSCDQSSIGPSSPPYCPAMDPAQMGDRVGLLWIGAQFYPTANAFLFEVGRMGISRRIRAVPRGFKLGEHWVFLAHPKCIRMSVSVIDADASDAEETTWTPGIFRIFRPTAIEKIVTQSEFDDEAAMAELREQGITPVPVGDNDKNHQGSVYDKDDGNEDI